MIEIENKLLSDDIVTEHFLCDLCKCKGACCVYGDSGAPLLESEIGQIEDCLDKVKPYMTEVGLKAVEEKGVFEIDFEGDYTTTLVEGTEECAFTFVSEDGMVLCAIEKAFRDGKIDFKKPISCHLYPIRVKEFKNNMVGLNYHRWDICKDAIQNGEKCGVKVYQGVKDAIVRQWGEEFYSYIEDVDRIITNGEVEEE